MLRLFSFFKRSKLGTTYQRVPHQAPNYSREEAERFVSRLTDLGYFKYADFADVAPMKERMIEEYDPNSELTCFWDDNDTTTPKDYRYYFCDNESLFEAGGFADMLTELQPTFDKIGLQFTITDHHEVWDRTGKWLDHTITINGNTYTIFKHFKGMGWGEAVQRLIEILNAELEGQNKEDRVYVVSGGNDGRIIFLSNEQFNYIDSIYKDKEWKPLRLSEWIEVMS